MMLNFEMKTSLFYLLIFKKNIK